MLGNEGLQVKQSKSLLPITTEISTCGRYHSTLPLTLISIAQQTHPPEEIIIYDDGEQKDLRRDPLYEHIIGLMSDKGIDWKVSYGDRIGQVANHQRAIREAKHNLIWRIDDDEIAEPNTLNTLYQHIHNDTSLGAVSGLILHPNSMILELPDWYVHNTIEYCEDPSMQNIVWFRQSGSKEVDHLYSTFLYRKEAAKHGYCMDLSPVGHREETIFTYGIKRSGWSLLVDPSTTTWHFRYAIGGIRSVGYNKAMFDFDEKIFHQKLKEWGITLKYNKIIILDNGLGDHLAFKKVLPDIIKQNENGRIILACCYPEVFEEYKDKITKMISIHEARFYGLHVDNHNIYRWMWENNWDKHITEAYRRLYANSN